MAFSLNANHQKSILLLTCLFEWAGASWERIALKRNGDETSKGPPELAIGADDAQNLGG
jgi:hypothetical protein